MSEAVVLLADEWLLQLPLEALNIFAVPQITSLSRDFSLQFHYHRVHPAERSGKYFTFTIAKMPVWIFLFLNIHASACCASYSSTRAVFKWLSKVITWLRLLRLMIGLRTFAPKSSYGEIFFISPLQKWKKKMGVTDFVPEKMAVEKYLNFDKSVIITRCSLLC